MINEKFSKNEIITIVMTLLEGKESEAIYGEIAEDMIYFPKPIEEKLNNMSSNYYNDFFMKIDKIADEIYKLKSGELNELNFLHNEIGILCEEALKDYLKK